MDRKVYKDALTRIGINSTTIEENVRRLKLKHLGHIKHHDTLVTHIVEEKKRKQKRKRKANQKMGARHGGPSRSNNNPSRKTGRRSSATPRGSFNKRRLTKRSALKKKKVTSEEL